MLFNTFEFGVFFTIVFFIYWFVCNKSLPLQNLFLLAASYLFYGWWDWRFLGLIVLTTLSDFIAAICIERYPNRKKLFLFWTIFLNLGVLFYFKYSDFFITSLETALAIDTGFIFKNMILPVGISFYTFQSISYIVDVYQGRLKASTNLINYATFIAFFPQLVAGPIERATALLPQIAAPRIFDYHLARLGMRLVLWGLFKKIMIADNCALIVDQIYEQLHHVDAITLWIGAFLFSIQIYCDFSGYSDIAQGIAYLLGISLMDNFKRPYLSLNIQDFWKRWHISLTTWFKDYVFMPLGGSRVSLIRHCKNVMLVFLLSGLWHGANLTFIVWGLCHALCYLVYHYLLKPLTSHSSNLIFNIVSWSSTLLFTTLLWIVFRSNSLAVAKTYFSGMITKHTSQTYHEYIDLKCVIGILILMAIELSIENKWYKPDWLLPKYAYIRWIIYFILVLIMLIYGNFNAHHFIYFNF